MPGKPVIISRHDLRALLHWATFGIRNSTSGSYEEDIVDIVNFYARELKFQLGAEPEFKDDSQGQI